MLSSQSVCYHSVVSICLQSSAVVPGRYNSVHRRVTYGAIGHVRSLARPRGAWESQSASKRARAPAARPPGLPGV